MSYRGKHEAAHEKTSYSRPARKKRGIGLRAVIHWLSILGLVIVGFLIVRHVVQDIRSDRLNEKISAEVVEKLPALPSNTPKPTPAPTPSPKPSATPAPTASPSPTPSPEPTTSPCFVSGLMLSRRSST